MPVFCCMLITIYLLWTRLSLIPYYFPRLLRDQIISTDATARTTAAIMIMITCILPPASDVAPAVAAGVLVAAAGVTVAAPLEDGTIAGAAVVAAVDGTAVAAVAVLTGDAVVAAGVLTGF
jgi:hypothetical protein